MRTFTISRLTLLEIGGWLTLGLLFWLLLTTHNVIARPLTAASVPTEVVAAPLPPAAFASEVTQPTTVQPTTARPNANDLFWQTRLRLRHDLPVRGLLGNWTPNRNRYTLTERRRPAKTATPSKPKAVILTRPQTQVANLGPALGSIYQHAAI